MLTYERRLRILSWITYWLIPLMLLLEGVMAWLGIAHIGGVFVLALGLAVFVAQINLLVCPHCKKNFGPGPLYKTHKVTDFECPHCHKIITLE